MSAIEYAFFQPVFLSSGYVTCAEKNSSNGYTPNIHIYPTPPFGQRMTQGQF